MAKRETDMRNKADILYENLVQTIEAIPPGEQLPSVRQLMYRHSVCQQVVVQVLDRLEKYGRIVRRPGKGVFRAGGVRSGPFRLALATPDWPALQYSEFEARLIQEGKKREFEIERVYFSLSGHNIFHELPIREYHAVVLLGNRPLSIDDLNLIANSPTPMLLIGRTFYGTGLNYIGSDPMKNGMLAARYLLDCGHRNIGVVVSESREFEIARQRLDGFRFWAENHSCRLTVIDPEIRSGGDPAQKSYEAMKYLLAQGKPEFTALYALSDPSCLGIIKALQEYGIRVPEEVGVVGSDGICQSAFYTPSLTTVSLDFTDYAEQVLDAAEKLYQDRNCLIQREMVPFILERSSILRRF